MGVLRSGLLYFAVTYAAGFVAGSLRQLLIVPRFGPVVATLVEAPVMLAVCILAARWVVGRFNPSPTLRERLAIGLTGFAFLMLAELTSSVIIYGWTPAQWLNHFGTLDGAISLLMFLIFAVLPLAARRG